MDSLPEEQQRGITMKSSCITLVHGHTPPTEAPAEGDSAEHPVAAVPYLVNLIDCPGHVDFSHEVSTAVRVCDGALVLVDVLEGVGKQTFVVLKQAWQEQVKPVLVLNKIDRLITELKKTPLEAYRHLRDVLEQVNAITGELFASEVIDEYMRRDADDAAAEVQYEGDAIEDEHLYFSPERGNVVFASARDGWAFGLENFVGLYAKKMGASQRVLRQTLWGDFYYNPKTKRIVKQDSTGKLKPMFVSMVLDNIWAVYNATILDYNAEKVQKIVGALGLKLLPRDLSHKDPELLLRTVISKWLPLSSAVLDMVVQQLPSPRAAQELRLPKLMPSLVPDEGAPLSEEQEQLRHAIVTCDASADAPVVVFISKMFAVGRDALPAKRAVIDHKARDERVEERRRARERDDARRRELAAQTVSTEDKTRGGRRKKDDGGDLYKRMDGHDVADAAPSDFVSVTSELSSAQAATEDGSELGADDDKGKGEARPEEPLPTEVFVGLARIFSGTLRPGQDVFVLGPKYDPRRPDEHCARIPVKDLFLLMGRSLEYAPQVHAGNVFGIGGLEAEVFKTGTIASTQACPSFTEMMQHAQPIVRVAVEPVRPVDMPALKEGLRILNLADPCIQVRFQKTGEMVVLAAGELHLERCLKDLKERYAKVDIWVSPPIVSFRETIAPLDDAVDPAMPTGVVEVLIANKQIAIRMRALPLPPALTKALEDSEDVLRELLVPNEASGHAWGSEYMTTRRATVREALDKSLHEAHPWWRAQLDRIWALGPQRVGPNLLFSAIPEAERFSLWVPPQTGEDRQLASRVASVISGFQLAAQAGPICDEPMMGVCFCVEDVRNVGESTEEGSEVYGPVSGQIMSTTKEACRQALAAQPARIMEPMYRCEIQATADALGRLYSVLGKRRGKVTKELMKEGTPLFLIECLLPVVESFGFAEDMRRRTSGLINPQLFFSSFVVNPKDPYWVPTTDEEKEEHGDKDVSPNPARDIMNAVRKRKGLTVDEKLVEHGDKQRTLTRMK